MTHDTAPETWALLNYHSREHCSPQWRTFLPLLFAELYRNASQADADAFLRQLGAQLAQRLPLDDQATLEGLERAINRHWTEMRWGFVRLHTDGTGISITHAACPVPKGENKVNDATGERAMAAVLEGTYGEWFKGQGGDDRVPLRALPESIELPGCVRLRYAHHDTRRAP